MDWNNLFESKKFKRLLVAVLSVIVLLLVFQVGVFVGFQKARFSFGWAKNYNVVFGGPERGFLQSFEGEDFISGHGTAGTIVKVDDPNIIIKSKDNVEKIVTTTDKTTIKNGKADIKLSDLAVDQQIVVIGAPDGEGNINAKIIRIFDPEDVPMPPPGPVNFFEIINQR
jgi:hypothetical protein